MVWKISVTDLQIKALDLYPNHLVVRVKKKILYSAIKKDFKAIKKRLSKHG